MILEAPPQKSLMTSLALILLFVGCKEQEITTYPAPGPIVVDGQSADWESVASTFYEKQNASLRLCNDNENLYLLFESRDPQTARMIRFTGLTIYLDKDGKKSRDFFVRFRGGPKSDRIRPPRPGGDERGLDDSFGPERDTATQFTCFEKDNIIEKPIPTDGSEGPAVAFSAERGVFVYELRIPLTPSVVRYYGLGASAGLKLGLGLIWGERNFSGPASRGRPGGGTGVNIGSGGGGGVFGGGRGSGLPGGGNRSRFEKQEVWLKTTLALPPEVSQAVD